MTGVTRTMGFTEWSLLIILSLLWGGSFFFVGVAVKALPPFTIVTLRVGLAAVALYVFVLASGRRMPADARIWVAFFGMGFMNNVTPFCLIVWGQTHIASGLASILNATTPLFSVMVAHWFTRDEKLTPGRLAGVAMGFTGVVVIIGHDVLHDLGTHSLAQFAVLGAAISYSCAAVFGRRFRSLGIAPQVTATGQVAASTLMLIPVTLFVDRPWTLPVPDAEVWAAILCLAILSTAVAYIIYFRILASSGATNILLVTFLIPVSAIWLGVTVLGEQLLARHLAGMALIGLGLAVLDGRVFGGTAAAPAAPGRDRSFHSGR